MDTADFFKQTHQTVRRLSVPPSNSVGEEPASEPSKKLCFREPYRSRLTEEAPYLLIVVTKLTARLQRIELDLSKVITETDGKSKSAMSR